MYYTLIYIRTRLYVAYRLFIHDIPSAWYALGVIDGLHLGGRYVETLPEVEILAGVEDVGQGNGDVGGVEDYHNTPFFFMSAVMSSTR